MVRVLPSGYSLHPGSSLDQALLVQFMQRTYQEVGVSQAAHLAQTVHQYLSADTPLWWVLPEGEMSDLVNYKPNNSMRASTMSSALSPVACLWIGNAIDQVQGDRHAHIFLLYVMPEHRRRGIGAALMQYAEDWAKGRGDRQIGLQVFTSNQPALSLYQKFGYQPQSIWMTKSLGV